MKYIYEEKLVSLVTPGWNGKSFVHRLLDSIIEQTYRPLQYIYVDDCSNDGTIDVVKSYATKFREKGIDFTLIERKENGGLSEAVMTGLQYVRGEFFSCPEYDDLLFPKSVEKRVLYLQKHPDCAVVTADAWVVPESDLNIRTHRISNNNINRFDRNHFYQSCLSRSIYNAACYMVRSEMFDETHLGRRFHSSRIGSNQQILLPLYYHWNRGFIEEPLSLFVMRSNSVSHSNKSTLNQNLDRIEEYRRNILLTLETIDMPNEDRDCYKRQIYLKYQKDYMDLGFKYRNKEVFWSAYRCLDKAGELPTCSKEQKMLMESTLLYTLYNFKNYMLNIIYRVYNKIHFM